MDMIVLKKITYHAGSFLLKELNHSFQLNKFHIILGPSGSGKSVLLEIIAGLLKPCSGKIFLNETDITTFYPEQRNFGYLPQDNALFPHLNVIENIRYGLKIKNKTDDEFIREIAKKIYIEHLLNRSIDNLSGGEIQRIALARSLAAGNKILLLDEPTSALHLSLRNELCYLLKEIKEQFQLTVIMVTHDIESAFILGESISFLINGEIVQTFYNYQNVFIPSNKLIADFLGMKNIFSGTFRNEKDLAIIACNELGIDITVNNNLIFENKEISFGIKADDIRVIFPERAIEYLSTPNKIKGMIKHVYRKAHSLTIIFKPNNTNSFLEIEYPITKTNKIKIKENEEYEIFFKPDRVFIFS